MEELLKDLIKYLKDNFIDFQNEDNVFTINGKTYELFEPNEDGLFFDERFHWDCDKTDCDFYIFKFGGVWYSIKSGDENSVKLERMKWIGKVDLEFPELQQNVFLGVHGPFEFLDGSGPYKDWAKKAKFLGIEKLGICELGTLAGIFKFQTACEKEGINSILGMEVPIKNEKKDLKYTVKAFVKNETGWRNLLQISREIKVENNGFISEEDFVSLKGGLIVILDPKTLDFDNLSSCWRKLPLYYQLDTVVYKREERDKEYLLNLKKYFNSNFKPIAMSDAYYLEKEYAFIREKLNRVSGKMNHSSNNQYFKNGQEYFEEFKSLFKEDDFDRMFDIFEEAIKNLNIVGENCNYIVESGQRHLPEYVMTEEEKEKYGDNRTMFEELVYEGLEEHMDLLDNYGEDVVSERIAKEIETIEYGEVSDYFLILRDIINWSRKNEILLGAGRGSCAGSLVTYLLGITKVDPLRYGLLFERFLNKGRVKVSLPDIDTDFQGIERPRVKEYMEQRFGVDQVCSVGTFTTLQLKAAITDFAKLYGVDIASIRRFNSKLSMDTKTVEDFFKDVSGSKEMREFVKKHTELFNLIFLTLGQPKAPSIHACAMMIFPKEKTLYEWTPVRKQNDLIVSEWEGGELDSAGFLKEDILGIELLDKFSEILSLVEKNHGRKIDLYKDIPYNDPKVYEYFEKGWLSDVFHFGAKGLSSYVVKMKPKSIDDLALCAALYRPGTIENNYHNEYLLRRDGEKEVEYRVGTEKVLEDTCGIQIFQEQIMSLMNVLGGMDLVTCDTARKSLGKKKLDVLQSLKAQFVENYCTEFGVSEEYAESFWHEIEKASSYLFNKCISGRERLHRPLNRKDSSGFSPTIEEMYKICNDYSYAKATGHESLNYKYNRNGYGTTWFLDKDKRIRKASIRGIYFSGYRQTYKITLENGKTVSVTDNHKFLTTQGKRETKDLKIGDELFCLKGYEVGDSSYRYTIPNKGPSGTKFEYTVNSEKGKMGFQRRDNSPYVKNREFLKEKKNVCEVCEKESSRIEVHHKDGDHGNAERENLICVCPSCHKLLHYQMGRNKQGDKGLLSEVSKIISIEEDRIESVYDIEIDHPEHNFVTGEGIVTCNSHAVAYSINGYNSLWLKVHYPIEFWSVIFSRASMDDYPLYINEIQNSGDIQINPVDINHSGIGIVSSVETNSMYWAFNSVKQVGEKAQEQLLKEREENGIYFSFDEFVDRQTFTGSPINKSTIENLIYSGAFDSFNEKGNVSVYKFRESLLLRYRKNQKVKIDENKDEYTLALNSDHKKTSLDWWWQLQQKRKSGLAFFDYRNLTGTYLRSKMNDVEHLDIKELDSWEEDASRDTFAVGGVVVEVIERSSKKGPFCNIIIESNYEFFEVLVFPELYEEQKEFLNSSVKNILLLTGNIVWNKFHEKYIIQTSNYTEFVKLSLV